MPLTNRFDLTRYDRKYLREETVHTDSTTAVLTYDLIHLPFHFTHYGEEYLTRALTLGKETLVFPATSPLF